jgi:hypothetical protein
MLMDGSERYPCAWPSSARESFFSLRLSFGMLVSAHSLKAMALLFKFWHMIMQNIVDYQVVSIDITADRLHGKA